MRLQWGMTEVTVWPIKVIFSEWFWTTRALGENSTVEEGSWKGGKKFQKQFSPSWEFTKILCCIQCHYFYPDRVSTKGLLLNEEMSEWMMSGIGFKRPPSSTPLFYHQYN